MNSTHQIDFFLRTGPPFRTCDFPAHTAQPVSYSCWKGLLPWAPAREPGLVGVLRVGVRPPGAGHVTEGRRDLGPGGGRDAIQIRNPLQRPTTVVQNLVRVVAGPAQTRGWGRLEAILQL